MYYYIQRITLFYLGASMARAGILYSHVAQVAAKLIAAGKNPTVDNVREALGGTGSKSTIAPFLKRWKAEHQEVAFSAELGLPAELLQTIKGLYDQLRADARQEWEQARFQQQSALGELHDQLAKRDTDNGHLSAANAALRIELDHTTRTLEQLQAAHQDQSIALAGALADHAGAQQRLIDRQSELEALHRQLDQARTQFEHYQEAVALQRTEERQQAEQQRLRLDSELSQACQSFAAQQAILAQRDQDLARLQRDNERVAIELAAAQASVAGLEAERRHQQQLNAALKEQLAQLQARFEATSAGLAQANNEHAVLAGATEQLQSYVEGMEADLRTLREENKNLAIDKARLEGLRDRTAATGTI